MARRGGRDDRNGPDDPWGGDLPPLDLDVHHRRQARKLEAEMRRRAARQRLIGIIVGSVVAIGLGIGTYWWVSGNEAAPDPPVADAPVRVELDDLPEDPIPDPDEPVAPVTEEDGPSAPVTDEDTTASTASTTLREPRRPRATTPAAPPVAPTRARKPIVWVQAGHADPREPGYRDQTGAGSGPFGSEIGFTTALAPKVIARLQRAGVDARATQGQVDPWGARGAVFISLHHDSPGGAAAFGHAIAGAGENYYRGEGSGDPSPTPYPDSAPHRDATTVSGDVESNSRALAQALDGAYRPIYTAGNGAYGRYGGVQTREGNPRMMRYYGFYRTRAAARVIVEAGAAGADDTFLAKTDLIAGAVADGTIAYLRSRGLL